MRLGRVNLRQIFQQISQTKPQYRCDHAKIENGDIAFAAFDGADERAVKLALVGQIFLCPAASLAQLTQAVTQITQEFSVA